MCVRLVLALALVSVAAAAGAGVSLWRDAVTLTCPKSGDWFKVAGSGSESLGKTDTKHGYTYKGGNDQFYCEYGDNDDKKNYHFYIQGKECGNCVELDAYLFAVVIVAEVIGTVLLMVLIYRCCRRSGGGAQKPKASPRNIPQEIPMDSTYEGLSHNTRSQDIYSRINNTRTG